MYFHRLVIVCICSYDPADDSVWEADDSVWE